MWCQFQDKCTDVTFFTLSVWRHNEVEVILEEKQNLIFNVSNGVDFFLRIQEKYVPFH